MTSYCCWVRSEIELLSGGRLATFFPTLFFRSKKGSHNFPSQSSHLLTLTREGGHTFPAALFLPQTLVHINMNKRSSPLKARKNNAKPSAKPSAAPLLRRHVSDLADCDDCSATIAEGIPLAAPPAAASAPAPAPAPVPLDPGAQLTAAVNGGILPAAGRERAQLSGEAPLGDGSADASIEPPRAPAQAPPAPAPAPASAPVPASAPPPASASALLPAATKVTPSFYNW